MTIHGSSRSAVRISLLVLVILAGYPASAGNAQELTPEGATLLLRTRYGLAKLSDRDVWVIREERLLRADLAALDGLQENLVRLQKKVSDWGEVADRRRPLCRRDIANLEAYLESNKQLAKSARKMRQEQLDFLNDQLERLDKLGNVPIVQSDVQDLIVVRNRLAIAVLRIKRSWPEVKTGYGELRGNTEVEQALQTFPTEQTLGPAEDYEQRVPAQTAAAEQLVFTHENPAYLMGNVIRTSAILNESVPIDCSWLSNGPRQMRVFTAEEFRANPPKGKSKAGRQLPGRPLTQAVLMRHMADSAGISVSSESPGFVLFVPATGQRIQGVRQVQATIRMGSCVAENIDVLVLPPQAAPLGANLSIQALPGFTVEEDLLHLKLKIYESGSSADG